MNVDFKLLNILIALVEEKGVAAAGRRMNLSQSTMSHGLSRLRDALDDPILIRSGNHMLPSAKALELLPQAKQLNDSVGQFFAANTSFEAANNDNNFRFAMSDYGQLCVLPQLFNELEINAPGITIDIHRLQQSHEVGHLLGKQLIDGDIDFVIAPTHSTPKDFRSYTIFEDTFSVIVSKNHSRIKDTLSLEHYLNEKHLLISPLGNRSGFVDLMLAEENLSRQVIHTLPDFISAVPIVERSDFLVTLPKRLTTYCRENSNINVFDSPFQLPTFSLSLYLHRRFEALPANKWMIDTIRSLRF